MLLRLAYLSVTNALAMLRLLAQGAIETRMSRSSFATPDHGAATATRSARAVGHLVETARQQRQLPFEAVSAWHAMRMRVQRSLPRAWDAAPEALSG